MNIDSNIPNKHLVTHKGKEIGYITIIYQDMWWILSDFFPNHSEESNIFVEIAEKLVEKEVRASPTLGILIEFYSEDKSLYGLVYSFKDSKLYFRSFFNKENITWLLNNAQ